MLYILIGLFKNDIILVCDIFSIYVGQIGTKGVIRTDILQYMFFISQRFDLMPSSGETDLLIAPFPLDEDI